jgi:PIN domain nuclease of toxin-antitoxin system
MTAILLDTHAWAWSMTADDRLSEAAIAAMARAETILVSPISFFEIGQKVRIGKWPEMSPFIGRLSALLTEQGGVFAVLDHAVCLNAAAMEWTHRDPFDRLLAATAIQHNAPIVSADVIFDSMIRRIW